MRDIETRGDIESILKEFYAAAFSDGLIGHFFTQVIPLDLATHLPLIADFWEATVLGARPYERNVMAIHQHLHGLSPLRKEHLDRWVALFTKAVSDNYAGPHATVMLQRGRSVATLMDIKLNHPKTGL